MKKLINILFGSALLFSFAQCGNSKEMAYKLQETSNLKISDAIYQSWVAGVRGGGGGINVIFKASGLDSKNIEIDSLFFRGQIAKVEKKPTVYVARFNTKINQRPDIIMSAETDQEYGNKAPIKTSKFPFDLEDDEAVIGYKEKGKQKYFKLKLQKKKSQLYQ